MNVYLNENEKGIAIQMELGTKIATKEEVFIDLETDRVGAEEG